MEEIIHSRSIADVYNFFGIEKLPHPLIPVIRQWPKSKHELSAIKFTSELYYMTMKRDIRGSFQYGRNSYDYKEGTMVFIGPGQVATFTTPQSEPESQGWTILFHPDLINKSELGKRIHEYSFFSYDTTEALHLSEKEKAFLNTLVDTIEQEIKQDTDRHSQTLIVQNLETILKYCSRYYDRQFYTRTNLNKDVISRFDSFLKAWFHSDQLINHGMPSIEQCGEALNMSGPYLSDLLKTETGRSA